MNALDIFDAEMDFNVAESENKRLFNITLGDETFKDVHGIVSEAWKRKEKDGRLDPGSPIEIPSVVIPIATLRSFGIEATDYKKLIVEVEGVEYGVLSHTDGNPVRLFLKTDLYDEPEDNTEPEDDIEPPPNDDNDPEPIP